MNSRFSPASQRDRGVVGERLVEDADDPLRQQRDVVGRELRRGELGVAVERLGAPGRRRTRAGATGAAHGGAQPVEHDAGVADEDVVGRERPRRVERLDVDLDQRLAGRVEEVDVLVGGVVGAELGADREHDVGAADDLVGARPAERAHHAGGERIGLVEHALAAGRGDDRDVEGAGERGQLRRTPGRRARRCRR